MLKKQYVILFVFIFSIVKASHKNKLSVLPIEGVQNLIVQYLEDWASDKTLKSHYDFGDLVINLKDISNFIWGEARDNCNLYDDEEISSMDFSKDGNFLVTASTFKKIKIWDISLGKCIKTFFHRQCMPPKYSCYTHNVKYSPDGNYVASSSHGELDIWDINTGICIKKFNDFFRHHMCYSPCGKYLAYGSSKNLKLCDAISGNMIKNITGLGEDIKDIAPIAFSPQGESLVIYNNKEKKIKIYELSSDKYIQTLASSTFPNISYSKDGKFLVFVSDNHIKLWDINTSKCIRDNLIKDIDEVRYCMGCFFSNINYLLTKFYHLKNKCNEIKIYDATTGDCIEKVINFNDVKLIACSPCGRYIAVLDGNEIKILKNKALDLLY